MLINSPNISGSLKVTGNTVITGSLTVAGGINATITGSATTASYVEYSNVANKPTLVSGSAQVSFNGITDKPTLVSGSAQVSFNGITDKPTLVSGSSQITYSGLSGIPSGIVSGSAQIVGYNVFATTGSNVFQSNQTITGSLFITQNLVVAGSSSIQYISSSVVDIADNIITVNAFNPGVRFGGLAVADSGSSPRVSGSILFDSIKDQWIFVHENSATTSSVLLMGPETYNDLGNESYISTNRLPKGSGVEHLRDSNITDTGTVVSINSNTTVTGSFTVVTGSAVELQVTNTGVNIGSALIDSHIISGSVRINPNGLFVSGSGAVGIGTISPAAAFHTRVESASEVDIARFQVTNSSNNIFLDITGDEVNRNIIFDASGTSGGSYIFRSGGSPRMVLTSGGNVGIGTTSITNGTTFGGGGQINRLKVQSTNYTCLEINGSTSGGSVQFTYGTNLPNQVAGLLAYNYANGAANEFAISNILSGPLIFATSNTERMRIFANGNVAIQDTFVDNGSKLNITSGAKGGIRIVTDAGHQAISIGGTGAFSIDWPGVGSGRFLVRDDGLIAFPRINDFTTGNSPNTWINPSASYGIYINTSSIRYKKDIVNYNKGLDIVNQLRPVYYKGISEVDGDKQFVGLIAEEIHDLGLTEFVNYNEEGLPNSLSYPNMVALAFKAIQEQQTQIEILKTKIEILEQS
jgi:hypothetical protein